MTFLTIVESILNIIFAGYTDYVGFYENRQNIKVTSNIIIRRVLNSFFSQLIQNNFVYV